MSSSNPVPFGIRAGAGPGRPDGGVAELRKTLQTFGEKVAFGGGLGSLRMTNLSAKLLLAALLSLLVPGGFCWAADDVVATADAFRVDVRQAGAIGDGLADDGPAIRAAIRQVSAHGSGTLYFPGGSYRCARGGETGDSATINGIKFAGISNLTIEFAPGAELVMDNLNPATGAGDRGHGVFISGPAHDIKLLNVKVRWTNPPSTRSQGDGFRFFGFPAADRTLAHISLEHCSIENSPQAGAIFMGCSDVSVTDFAANHTRADGLHFNACQHVSVHGYRASANGDDGLAFVTYAPEAVPDSPSGPFSRPTVGEWSDTDSAADDILVQAGRANGVRISGALNVSISNVHVEGRETGIIVDSAKKERPIIGWSYQASQGIRITNLTAERCGIGLLVINHNVPPTDPEAWWRFDVAASDLHVAQSLVYGICLTRCAGVRLSGVDLGAKELRREGLLDYPQ